MVVIVILILGEIGSYCTLVTKENMIVDTTLGTHLRVNINVTFHALTCADAHLDAMDVAGDNQLNIEHDMIKQRLTSDGKLIGIPGIEIIGIDTNKMNEHDNVKLAKEILHPDYCGSCYGAETETRKCCNACQDIKEAYKEKGWGYGEVIRNAEQCLHDSDNPFAFVGKDEGCNIYGSMIVNKVAGNFHIADGESFVHDGKHIHTFNPEAVNNYNNSHTIHSLSFGEPYPSMPMNSLDKTTRIITHEVGTGLFQYFIKVVPTIYTSESNKKIMTNQYTYTEKFRPISLTPQAVIIPGIFFVYELTPFLIEVKRSSVPFSHLMKQIFAIVGGVFVIFGIIDGLIHKFFKSSSKKL